MASEHVDVFQAEPGLVQGSFPNSTEERGKIFVRRKIHFVAADIDEFGEKIWSEQPLESFPVSLSAENVP